MPGPGRMRHDDAHFGIPRGEIIDIWNGLAVFESNSLPARRTGGDSCRTSVKDHRQVELNDLFVHGKEALVIGIEALRGLLKFHSAQSHVRAALHFVNGNLAFPRIDASKAD